MRTELYSLVCLEAPVSEHAVVAQGDAEDTGDDVHHVADGSIAPGECPAGKHQQGCECKSGLKIVWGGVGRAQIQS